MILLVASSTDIASMNIAKHFCNIILSIRKIMFSKEILCTRPKSTEKKSLFVTLESRSHQCTRST